MLTKEEILEGIKSSVDEAVQANLKTVVGTEVSESVKKTVEAIRLEGKLFGYDRTGLNADQKKGLVHAMKAVAFGSHKANEAIIGEIDSRGGYLMPVEVADAIVRISRSVGLVAAKASQWTMTSNQMSIPAYTGSVLTGEFLGIDAAGSVTALTFKEATLIARKWQLAFAVGNDLLEASPVELADWLLALAGEARANMLDKQALAGTGAPFVGALYHPDATTFTLAAGKNTFAEYDVIDDSSEAIGNLEESLLGDAGFVFSRTVWASLRVQKDDNNQYLLGVGGMSQSSQLVVNDPKSEAGPQPVGSILGYPVYTNRNLPALSASAASTNFGLFLNFKCLGFGTLRDMRLEQFASGSFGGKEIALADQKAMVFKEQVAVTVTLPEGIVQIKTNAA